VNRITRLAVLVGIGVAALVAAEPAGAVVPTACAAQNPSLRLCATAYAESGAPVAKPGDVVAVSYSLTNQTAVPLTVVVRGSEIRPDGYRFKLALPRPHVFSVSPGATANGYALTEWTVTGGDYSGVYRFILFATVTSGPAEGLGQSKVVVSMRLRTPTPP
jgi:hypothetical protein